ncbi:hypothetical protein BHE74_00003974 [Ensete ventricosum]|nr:hypothetical protein BHE74_00003974 [Ensete ventricosum]
MWLSGACIRSTTMCQVPTWSGGAEVSGKVSGGRARAMGGGASRDRGFRTLIKLESVYPCLCYGCCELLESKLTIMNRRRLIGPKLLVEHYCLGSGLVEHYYPGSGLAEHYCSSFGLAKHCCLGFGLAEHCCSNSRLLSTTAWVLDWSSNAAQVMH